MIKTSENARTTLERIAKINGIMYSAQRKIVLSKIKCQQTTRFYIEDGVLKCPVTGEL